MLTKRIKFLGVFVLIIGLVVAMTGCDMGDGVVDEIEDEPLKITYIEEIPDKNVGHGTDFENINLPEEIEVTLSDNSTTSFNVTWLEDDYNGEIAGTYTIVGELELTDDIINPDDLYPTVQVAVQEEDITLYTVSVDYDDDKGKVAGDGDFEEGEEVELTATAKEGYEFVGWTGYVESTDNTINFDMPADDVELTAVFEELEKNSSTKTIDEKGGEISLDDGTTLEIPEGAVEEETEITLQKEDEDKYTDDEIYESNAYRVETDVEKFKDNIKLRFPLPENAPEDINSYLVGFVDEETGSVIYQGDTEWYIEENLEGKDELIFSTKYFSPDFEDGMETQQYINPDGTITMRYAKKDLDNDNAYLEIPSYSQTATQYCWAAAHQMHTKAYMPADTPDAIWGIIGKFGIDEGRFFGYGVLFDAVLGDETKDLYFNRTSSPIERVYWNTKHAYNFNLGVGFINYVKNQLDKGRPVFLVSQIRDHAWILIGYDDTGDELKFLVNDTNLTGAHQSPVKEKTEDDLGFGSIPLANAVATIVIPEKMDSSRSKATINIGGGNLHALKFIGYKENQPDKRNRLGWSHEVERGYNFEQEIINPDIYDEILLDDIAFANTSSKDKYVNLKIKIGAQKFAEQDYTTKNIGSFELRNNFFSDLDSLTDSTTSIYVEDFLIESEEKETYDMIFLLKEEEEILDKKEISFTVSSYILEDYQLTINTKGKGNTSPEEGPYTYNEGETVNISASPDEGWEFSHWEGEVADSDSAETTVTMDEDKTVTAHFVEADEPIEEYTLTIETKGSGSTDPAEGTHTFNKNEIVNILANPDEGWKFSHWEGDLNYTSSNKESAKTISRYDNLTSIENNTQVSKKSEVEFKSKDSSEKTIKMDNDKYLKAVFEKKEKEDTITTNISGEILGDGEYPVDHIEAIIFKEVNDSSWSGIKNTNINANGEFEFKDVKLEIESNYDVGFWQDKSRKSYYFHTYKDLNINSNTPVNYELGEIEMNTGSCLHLIVKDPNGNRMKNTRLDVSASSGGWSGFRTNSEGEIYFGLRESNDSDVKVSITDGENYYNYEEQTFEGITFNYREKTTLVVQF